MFTTPKHDSYSVGAIESALHILEGFKMEEASEVMKIHTMMPNGRSEFYLNFIELGNYLDTCWQLGYEKYGAADGVFDYEVSEQLGRLIVWMLRINKFSAEKVKETADFLLEEYFKDSRKYTEGMGV